MTAELTTHTYDADGNTVGSGLNTGTSGYVYDFENRLVGQAGLSMLYDGDGNRVSKTTANGTTLYLVDNQNPTGYAQVMDELQSSAVVRTYSWGLELISQTLPAGSPLSTSHSPLFYVFDGHGSVRALTNSAGAVTDTYDYDAFGNLIHSTGTTPNNYLFAGEQFDPDLRLYYNRARYLNTGTGRFWTMDEHEGDDEDPTTLHKYAYTGDEPTDRTDPSGYDFDIGSIAVGLSISNTLDSFPSLQLTQYAQGGSAEPRIATAQSERGVDFLKCHEGAPADCAPLLRVYDKDGSKAGNCTIGWGHKIRDGRCTTSDRASYASFTEEAADQLLFDDVLKIALTPIKRRVRVGLAQREFDALVDFTFNVGGANLGKSELLQQLNAGNYKQAGNGFLGWLRPASIRGRRVDEQNLWDKGDYTSNGHPIP